MGVVAQIWQAVSAGIILLLATRQASKLSSSGEFVASFVSLLALVLFVWLIEYEFLVSVPEWLSQFESLRLVVMAIAQLLILYLSYVLAAEINEWFEKTYMNGPYIWALALVVGLIIFIFSVAGVRFTRYSAPQRRHVDHLLKISNQAVDQFRTAASPAS